jgi:hypothetical protein
VVKGDAECCAACTEALITISEIPVEFEPPVTPAMMRTEGESHAQCGRNKRQSETVTGPGMNIMLIRGTHIPDTGAVQNNVYVRIAVRIVRLHVRHLHT